jgi:PAS domain S-box-containing protein
VLGEEAIAERPDGTRVPFIPYPVPLHDESGALVGAVNMLVDITDRNTAEETIRNREERLSAELAATRQLQAISTELVQEQNVDALYQKLVDAAAALMGSDYASMQMLHAERGTGGELRLLASRGFTPEATRFWGWVRVDSGCTCGEAMRSGKRAIAANVETCDFMAGTPDRTAYLEAGILAAQSTPLVSRSGRLLGMISTHWRRPHCPGESDLRHLDVLARQAADLIERAEADSALRQASANLEAELAAMQRLHALSVRVVEQANDLNSGMREVLSAAAELVKADKCTAQVLDEQGRLILASSLGFDDEFCRQFHTVTSDGFSTCAAALRRGERVVVEDLGNDANFLDFARLAAPHGVRAAMSTPLLGADGALVGVFTTHWTQPHRPGERELRLLDLYAQQAARQIERIQNQARVARNQRTLSDLVERAPFGIYIVDSQFRIQQMNAGSQTGAFLNVRPVIGRPFDEAMRILWPEPVALQIVSRFRHTLETGEPFYSADFTNPRDDIDAVESYEWELHRLTLPDGKHGVVCYYYDSTRLRQAEQAVRASEERFRSIVDQAEAGVAETDLAGRFVLVNDRYCDITGYSREELLRLRMQDLTHPDDLPRNAELFRQLCEAGTPFVIEKRYVRKDGSPVWVSNTVSCMEDAAGQPRNAVAICLDIDERRRSEEQRSLLLREMGHRVKNLFAVASSLVSMSARGARSVDELATTIRERLGALVRAHELVRPNIVEGATAPAPAASMLDALVAALLAPYRSNGRERIAMKGPAIPVGSRAATGLALVLHELGTNAVKYGALSGEAGSVEITWTADGQKVCLQWAELGGPALNGPPKEEGFGSRLARMSVTGQLGGEFLREWKSSGLLVHLVLPRDRLAS